MIKLKSDVTIKVKYRKGIRGYFLELILKFKEVGKIFSTKLVKNIYHMYTDDYDVLMNESTDFKKFLKDCVDFLEDYYTIKGEAIHMLEEYFTQKYKKYDDRLLKQLVKAVNKKNIKISKDKINS